MVVGRWAALGVAAALMVGCSSTPPDAAPASTTPSLAGLSGASSCTDETGDGVAPPADLLGVELAVDGEQLVVTWDATPPPGSDRSYYVELGTAYQVGVRKIDVGDYVDNVGFVFDKAAATQVDITPKVLEGDTRAQIAVPLAELTKVVQPVEWTATLTDNTVDLDSCSASWSALVP